ncbi:MAG: GIY-YIG nuclease family protein [Eubacteriales bacterium]
MYYVYILSDRKREVLYTSVTNDLEQKLKEHANLLTDGFAGNTLSQLLYYERMNDIKAAIAREKQIKEWTRQKKNSLISGMNPEWKDLFSEIV